MFGAGFFIIGYCHVEQSETSHTMALMNVEASFMNVMVYFVYHTILPSLGEYGSDEAKHLL